MTYASIEPYEPGDLLFFRSYDPLGNAIAIRTRCWLQWPWLPLWSHVGICAEVVLDDGEPYTLLFESTTLDHRPCVIRKKPIKGVQAHFPHVRTRDYDGDVWRFRPQHKLKAERLSDLAEFLLGEIGKPYDFDRAAELSAMRWWWQRPSTQPTPDKLFCSELAGEGCKILGLIDAERDCESLSPNDLGVILLHSGNVWPLRSASQTRQIKWKLAA